MVEAIGSQSGSSRCPGTRLCRDLPPPPSTGADSRTCVLQPGGTWQFCVLQPSPLRVNLDFSQKFDVQNLSQYFFFNGWGLKVSNFSCREYSSPAFDLASSEFPVLKFDSVLPSISHWKSACIGHFRYFESCRAEIRCWERFLIVMCYSVSS